MRELYAVELRAQESGQEALDRAARMVADWVARHYEDAGIEVESLLESGQHQIGVASIDVVDVGPGGYLLRWTFTDVEDSTLLWLTEIAISAGEERLRATTRIRIGQRPDAEVSVGPVAFAFRSPAIVRTLLREFTVFDVGARVLPNVELVGASAVGHLVEFMLDTTRRLPIVILTGEPSTGRPVINADELARQLAGLAHVRVLTSAFASRHLSSMVGLRLSVWGGSARIYFPGFTKDADSFDHKLWTSERLAHPHRLPLDAELRRWLGSLSSARTAAHPVIDRVRSRFAERAEELPEWARDYVDEIEGQNREQADALSTLRAALDDRDERIATLADELERVRRQFGEMVRAQGGTTTADEEPISRGEPSTVVEAVTWAIEDAGDEAVFLPGAKESGLAFTQYRDPAKLYRAIRDVAEASARFGDGSLGMSLSQWFAQRGYGYEARNHAARAARTRAEYRIRYRDQDEYMEPHLKVDEATSPDQCLRIYWYVDEDERIFVVGHIGRHLSE
jgi:hypothetical protein